MALELDSGGFNGEAVKKLKVDGTVDALGCPAKPLPNVVTEPPPPTTKQGRCSISR
jgi:hypothetical protein